MKSLVRSLTLTGAAVLLAAPAAPAQTLPPAAEVIDRYVQAIGGREAHLMPQSILMTGTFAMPAAGLTGSFNMAQAKPDRMKLQLDLPGIGEVLQGYDGKIGWSVNPMTGPMVFEGERLLQTQEESHFASGLRDPDLFQSRETIGEAESQGEACWQVKLVWKSGRESIDCYSKDTGLLLETSSNAVTDMGTVQTTMLYSDYKTFDGRRYPTRMVQQLMGQEQIMTIDSVAFNTVDPSRFAPPAAIRTLIEK